MISSGFFYVQMAKLVPKLMLRAQSVFIFFFEKGRGYLDIFIYIGNS